MGRNIPSGDNSNAMPRYLLIGILAVLFPLTTFPMKSQDLFSGENKQNSTNPSSANFVFSMLNVKIEHKTE